MFSWFWDVLGYFGLYHKSGKLLFLGLDNAGKTTLLGMLSQNRLSQHEPTQRPTSEELTLGNIKFQTFDLGGHEAARVVWKDYCVNASAIVFLVDCADSERFPDAKIELDGLLSDPDLKNVPFVILGNKVDVSTAVSEDHLRQALGLLQTTGKQTKRSALGGIRPMEVFMVSVVKRFGYGDAFRWLSNYID